MRKEIICCPPGSDAIQYAATYLSSLGFQITGAPAPNVTHLLLPVPTMPAAGAYLEPLLEELPEDLTVCGGNLDLPSLSKYRTVDFLQDPYYLADNAAITAECALRIMDSQLTTSLDANRILILGWGRIGKCLGQLLRSRGADVTIAARKDADLALIHALGYHSLPIRDAAKEAEHFDVIFNTVPEMILPGYKGRPGQIAIELASKPGMAGSSIISARGLPGKMAPKQSGILISQTFIRLALKKE